MADEKKTFLCSFCGKSQHEIKKLISGPAAFICNECVNFCLNLCAEDTQQTEPENITTQESALLENQRLRTLIEEAQRLLTREMQNRRRQTDLMESVIEKIEAILRPSKLELPGKGVDIQAIKPSTYE